MSPQAGWSHLQARAEDLLCQGTILFTLRFMTSLAVMHFTISWFGGCQQPVSDIANLQLALPAAARCRLPEVQCTARCKYSAAPASLLDMSLLAGVISWYHQLHSVQFVD